MAAADGGQGQAAICQRDAGDGARQWLTHTRHTAQEQALTTLSQGGWDGGGFFVLAAKNEGQPVCGEEHINNCVFRRGAGIPDGCNRPSQGTIHRIP